MKNSSHEPKTPTKGWISAPVRTEASYIVRLATGAYFVRADRGPDGTTEDRRQATRFQVKDGEWNASGWARRLLGTVEEF